MSYEDGEAHCKAVELTVILRCDIRGLITCRGPENTKRYWKKCASKADGQCAMALMAEKMRTGRIAGFQEKKERLVDFIKKDTKLNYSTTPEPKAYLLPELVGICKIAKRISTISVYATGAVDCSSSKGCDFVDHGRCTMVRAREAANQIIGAKMRLGKRRLTPAEYNEAIAKAREKIEGLVKTGNP